MTKYSLGFNDERQNELDEFVLDNAPKVQDRVKRIQAALSEAGFNLKTRTTESALLAMVHGLEVEEEEEPEPTPSGGDVYYFAEQVKPQAVKDRIPKVRAALEAAGINPVTRTTLAACRLISDSFKL
jgi:hypothetical protein